MDEQTTHWIGCETEHHACALARVEEARQELARWKADHTSAIELPESVVDDIAQRAALAAEDQARWAEEKLNLVAMALTGTATPEAAMTALGSDTIEARAAALAAAEAPPADTLADLVGRLAHWAKQNDAERFAGHVPTFLNPHTVAAWLGVDLSKHEPFPLSTEENTYGK